MKQHVLRRTVLALAITAASSQSFAVMPSPIEVDMTLNPAPVSYYESALMGITLNGAAELTDDFLDLQSNDINGLITNNATLSGTGDHIAGMDLEDNVIYGNVVNAGTLKIRGLGAIGMNSESNDVYGSVMNTGTIDVAGDYDELLDEGATGMLFEDTLAKGDTRNDGNILAAGENATGILIDDTLFEGYLINSNNASIKVSGDHSTALGIGESEVSVINNHGVMTADGLNAKAVDLDQSAFRMLVNSGQMVATGEGSDGIMLDNVTLLSDTSLPAANHGIVNSGRIAGDEYGIVIEGPLHDAETPLYIHLNNGSIAGGTAAIKGDGQDIVLNWKNGLITGDIDGIGNINVDGYVTFDGDDILGNAGSKLTVKENSWINFEGDTTNISQDLEVANSAAVRLYVTPDTDPNSPIMTVGGTATFAEGSQVLLEAKPYEFAPESAGTDYKIIQAGTLVDNGLVVDSMSYLLEVKDFFTSDNTLVATLAMKDYGTIEEIILADGVDYNGKTVFMAAMDILASMDENDPVFASIVDATPEERVAIAKQLMPELNGASTQAVIAGQNLIASVLGARADAIRSGASSGDMLAQTGLWMQALTNDADQDRRDGIDGYSADTNGFAIGADAKLNDQWTVGLAYSYLESDVKSDNGNTTDVTGHTGSVYAGFEAGNWFADGVLSYSQNDNETKRHIAGTTAEGNYDSDMFGAKIEGGYTFALSQELALEPLAALRYAQVSTDSYDEKGSSAALHIDSERFESAEAGLGLRLKGDFVLGSGVLKPEAKIMAYHDFAADSSSTTSTYILGGNAFTTFGASPVRDSYEAGVGATYELGNFSVGLSYDRLSKSGFDADTVTGKVRYDF